MRSYVSPTMESVGNSHVAAASVVVVPGFVVAIAAVAVAVGFAVVMY